MSAVVRKGANFSQSEPDFAKMLALAGGAGVRNGYSDRVPNMAGHTRLFDNSTYVTGASGVKTPHFKFEADAPFNAVRLWYMEKNASGVMGTFAAVVAATEDGRFDTVARCFLPIVNGTTYNSLATTDYGWRAATTGGAATFTPSPSPAVNNSGSLKCTDWIPCRSVPRADVIGGNPMLVAKVAQQNASAVFTQYNSDGTAYAAGRGQTFYRELLCGSTANDGVTTLSNIPAAVANKAGYHMYVWPEFSYDVPTRSVLIVGDSTSGSAFNAYGISWAEQALKSLSTQTAPISVCNLAGSGHSHTEYLLLLDYILAAGSTFTDIIFQGWSQNGFGGNLFGAETLIARDTAYLLKIRNAGFKVWMGTSYGVNSYSAPQEAGRLASIARIKSWAASGLVTLIDTDSVITDYSLGTGRLNPIYNSGDNIHSNPLGQDAMGALLTSVWK